VEDDDIEADALAVLEARFSLPARPTLGDFIATCVCLRPMAAVPLWTLGGAEARCAPPARLTVGDSMLAARDNMATMPRLESILY
jgi:hypothetical protein